VSVLFIKDPEQGDVSAQCQKGEQQGIDIEIVERQVIEKKVYPFDDIVLQITEGGKAFPVAGPESMKVGEEEMALAEAVIEEAPYISMSGIIFKGDPIVQASYRHP
jgi:hypothetical protein